MHAYDLQAQAAMSTGQACLAGGKETLLYTQAGKDADRLVHILGGQANMLTLFRRALGLFLSGTAAAEDLRWAEDLPTTRSQTVSSASAQFCNCVHQSQRVSRFRSAAARGSEIWL